MDFVSVRLPLGGFVLVCTLVNHDAEEWEGELDSGRGEGMELHSPLLFPDMVAAFRERSKTGQMQVNGWFKSLPDGVGHRVAELSWRSWHCCQS